MKLKYVGKEESGPAHGPSSEATSAQIPIFLIIIVSAYGAIFPNGFWVCYASFLFRYVDQVLSGLCFSIIFGCMSLLVDDVFGVLNE